MRYFRIPDFDKTQHYKDRTPPWIKLHRELIEDVESWSLSDGAKLLRVASMLLASCTNNRIPDNPEWVRAKTGIKGELPWDELVSRGFIEVEQNASTMLAECEQHACLEESREEESRGEGEPRAQAREPAPSKTRKPRGTEPPEGFDEFWTIYPRKDAKAEAVKAWRKLTPDDALQKMIRGGVERQKGSPQWIEDGGRFIPYPATFINGRLWENEGVKGIEKMKGAAGAVATTAGDGDFCPEHGAKWRVDEETGDRWCPGCEQVKRLAELEDDDENENEDAPGGGSVSTTAAGEGVPAVAVVAERALAAAGVGAAGASRLAPIKAVAHGLNGSHGAAGTPQGEGG